MPVGEKQIYRFGPFELDPQCGQLRKDGVGLKLQGQPVHILEILLEKPGQLVTREELRERLWASDTFVDFDHSLNTAIKKLRQALGDEAEKPRYVETLPRRGYRFIGEVPAKEHLCSQSLAAPHPTDEVGSTAATSVAEAGITATRSRRRARRGFLIASLSALSLLGSAAAAHWLIQPPRRPRIVNARALTKTGFRKSTTLSSKLVTDGVSVYFQEERPSGVATLQVHISGGEPSEVAVSSTDVGIQDISRDASSLLMTGANSEGGFDTWIQPLPVGPARMILKDARWQLFTPDGRSILFARNNDRDLYRANADGTDARRLATLPDISWPTISPDGRRMRFTIEPKYDLWEAAADGSNAHPILPEFAGGVAGMWSPDGRYFFFSYSAFDRDDLWSLPEARPWWRESTSRPLQLTFGPLSIGAPTVSKDGREIFAVAADRHGELSVYDTGSDRFVPYLNGIAACYVDFSRDGKWIAYVSYPEGTLWRSRIDGSERMQLTNAPLAVINPRWSPDGKLIVFTDFSNGDRGSMAFVGPHRIYLVSADGGAPVLLLAGPFGDPTWSPDGEAVAYSYMPSGRTGEIRIVDLQTQKSMTVPGSQGFWSPRWSPDGQHIAAIAMPLNKLGLFTFATKKWEILPIPPGLGWPTWSHNSKFLYAVNWRELSLVRFNLADHRVERIASIKGFRSTAYFFWGVGWFGLTPDDRPITTRDTGVEEVYAFDLEYK